MKPRPDRLACTPFVRVRHLSRFAHATRLNPDFSRIPFPPKSAIADCIDPIMGTGRIPRARASFRAHGSKVTSWSHIFPRVARRPRMSRARPAGAWPAPPRPPPATRPSALSISTPRIWVNNNTWGQDSSPAGLVRIHHHQQLHRLAHRFQLAQRPNNNSVKAYPSAVLGWHWGWHFQNTGLPVQLSANRDINTTTPIP